MEFHSVAFNCLVIVSNERLRRSFEIILSYSVSCLCKRVPFENGSPFYAGCKTKGTLNNRDQTL